MEPSFRVLHVLGILNQGGAENMVMSLYRNIDRKQAQFDFVVHTDQQGNFDAEVEMLGGKIYHAPKYTGINHISYSHWWRSFFREHPEYPIVHCHIRSTASMILSIAKKFKRVTIAHSHSTSNGNGWGGIIRNVWQKDIEKYSDHCLACSEEAGKWLFPHTEFTILKNAIDPIKFSYSPKNREDVRSELNIKDNFVVGHVGRHTYPKNPMFLLEIFSKISEFDDSARLLQVGTGELTEKMKTKCRELGIEDAVIFAGVRGDVERYYSAMDVFLFPSLWEGLPIVVIEAQTSGLQCIVSEEIPILADIGAGLFHAMCVKRAADEWAEVLLSYKWSTHLQNAADYTRRAGFDIVTTAKLLYKLYAHWINVNNLKIIRGGGKESL